MDYFEITLWTVGLGYSLRRPNNVVWHCWIFFGISALIIFLPVQLLTYIYLEELICCYSEAGDPVFTLVFAVVTIFHHHSTKIAW